MKQLVENNLRGKRVLLLFVLTNLVYALMLSVTIPQTVEFAGGMKLLDMMPTGYDSEYVNTLFAALGEAGRETYLYRQIPVDMLYPLLFAVTYCLVMAYFLKKLGKLHTSWFYLCLLPLLAGLADYLENGSIVIMVNSYPEVSPTSVAAANIFTLVKSGATSVYFTSLLVVMAVFGIRKFTYQKPTINPA
jgi:hypothetical protein